LPRGALVACSLRRNASLINAPGRDSRTTTGGRHKSHAARKKDVVMQRLLDASLAVLRVLRAEAAVVGQRDIVRRLKAARLSTEAAENLLRTLTESLGLAKEHLGLVTGVMHRCHLMSGDQIEDVHFYECADDAAAILQFTILLDSKPIDLEAEIWCGTRLVTRIPKRRRFSKK
jgi:hypothetical protein